MSGEMRELTREELLNQRNHYMAHCSCPRSPACEPHGWAGVRSMEHPIGYTPEVCADHAHAGDLPKPLVSAEVEAAMRATIDYNEKPLPRWERMAGGRVYLLAAHELTELLHAWSVRWVSSHVEDDRYSCGARVMADQLLVNDGTPLLLAEPAEPPVTVTWGGDPAHKWVRCTCPPGPTFSDMCPVHGPQSTPT